jgi:hypothetical protein
MEWDQSYHNLSDDCQSFGVFKQLQDYLIGTSDVCDADYPSFSSKQLI